MVGIRYSTFGISSAPTSSLQLATVKPLTSDNHNDQYTLTFRKDSFDNMVHVWLQWLVVGLPVVHAFSTLSNVALEQRLTSPQRQPYNDNVNHHILQAMNDKDDINDESNTRRKIIQSVSKICALMFLGIESIPSAARADDATATAVAMKTFVDPEGLFIINIPQRFFAIRRTNQGDLPNSATGSGRRGSSIFNAGDLAKAEVLAIERYVTLHDFFISFMENDSQ